eukprot:340418-Chlamydomonas_euryale.AAC.1
MPRAPLQWPPPQALFRASAASAARGTPALEPPSHDAATAAGARGAGALGGVRTSGVFPQISLDDAKLCCAQALDDAPGDVAGNAGE